MNIHPIRPQQISPIIAHTPTRKTALQAQPVRVFAPTRQQQSGGLQLVPPRPLTKKNESRNALLQLEHHDSLQEAHNEGLNVIQSLRDQGSDHAATASVGTWELMANTTPTSFGKQTLATLARHAHPDLANTEVHVNNIELTVGKGGNLSRKAYFATQDGRTGVLQREGTLTWEGKNVARFTWKHTSVRYSDGAPTQHFDYGLPALPHNVPFADDGVMLVQRCNGWGPQSVQGWRRV